ncbi:MAG: D-3-phosphoglycerate dehydrogenase, partial [uncultured Rubrobacteraceae bacterium]
DDRRRGQFFRGGVRPAFSGGGRAAGGSLPARPRPAAAVARRPQRPGGLGADAGGRGGVSEDARGGGGSVRFPARARPGPRGGRPEASVGAGEHGRGRGGGAGGGPVGPGRGGGDDGQRDLLGPARGVRAHGHAPARQGPGPLEEGQGNAHLAAGHDRHAGAQDAVRRGDRKHRQGRSRQGPPLRHARRRREACGGRGRRRLGLLRRAPRDPELAGRFGRGGLRRPHAPRYAADGGAVRRADHGRHQARRVPHQRRARQGGGGGGARRGFAGRSPLGGGARCVRGRAVAGGEPALGHGERDHKRPHHRRRARSHKRRPGRPVLREPTALPGGRGAAQRARQAAAVL